MLELLLCSLLTIFPDYLFRRYVQGKRFGKEITFFSVWFELRWGITACLILTVCLITVIFYNHPSTTNVTLFFRTVPILPETNGRVAEIYVGKSGTSRQGRADLQAGQFEAAGRASRPPGARSPRSRRKSPLREPISQRPKVSSRRPRARTSRPWTNWRPSRSCIERNPGNVPLPRNRKARGPCAGELGRDRCRHRRETGHRDTDLDAASRREGERRSRAERRRRSSSTRPSSVPA